MHTYRKILVPKHLLLSLGLYLFIILVEYAVRLLQTGVG